MDELSHRLLCDPGGLGHVGHASTAVDGEPADHRDVGAPKVLKPTGSNLSLETVLEQVVGADECPTDVLASERRFDDPTVPIRDPIDNQVA